MKKKNFSKKKPNGAFHFPDGGWECSTCQNYNFKGRMDCNRCKKLKSKNDTDGKPLHLLKQDLKAAETNLNMQQLKMKAGKVNKFNS
jgi:hypothetical protein